MDRPTLDALSALAIPSRRELAAHWIAEDIVAAYGGTLRYATGQGVGFWRTDRPFSEAVGGGPDIDAEIVRRINPLRDEFQAATGRAVPWNVKAHREVIAAIRRDLRVSHNGGRREVEAYFDIAKAAR